MISPIRVSRKEFEGNEGIRWNAMIRLVVDFDTIEFSPIQRTAHLVFICSGEIYNGGYDQLVSNNPDWNYFEVITAFEDIGALEQARVLRDFMQRVTVSPFGELRTIDQYFEEEEEGSTSFDTRFYDCEPSVETYLENYLDKHESEFIEWVP